MARRGRPTASCVLLEGVSAAPVLVESFDLTSASGDLPTQLHDLATGLRSRLHGLSPDVVVIRRADYSPRASNAEGPRVRLMAEGALVAASVDVVTSVVLLPGRDLAARAGVDKAALDARAASLCPDTPVEATAAAVVGLA